MISDPVHGLFEIHRVLKPGGHLILSTPTPSVPRMFGSSSPAQHLPALLRYGPYARHNREFSVGELRELLHANRFSVEEVQLSRDDSYDHPGWADRLLRWSSRRRLLGPIQDVIHLRAQAYGRRCTGTRPACSSTCIISIGSMPATPRWGERRRAVRQRLLSPRVLAALRPLDRADRRGLAALAGRGQPARPLLRRAAELPTPCTAPLCAGTPLRLRRQPGHLG